MSAWRPRLTVPILGPGSDFVLGPLAALDQVLLADFGTDCWGALGSFTGPRTLELVAQQWC